MSKTRIQPHRGLILLSDKILRNLNRDGRLNGVQKVVSSNLTVPTILSLHEQSRGRQTRDNEEKRSDRMKTKSIGEQQKNGTNLKSSPGWPKLVGTKRNDMTTTEVQPDELAINLLQRILAEITTEPEKIQIESQPCGYTALDVVIRADSTDYGKVLGQGQKHLAAMKTICKRISDIHGASIQLSLEEALGGVRRELPRFEAKEVWRKAEVEKLFQDIFGAILEWPCAVVVSDGKNGKTSVEVVVSESESVRTLEWIKPKLQPLVESIGLKNGRVMFLNFIRDNSLLARAQAA